MSIRAHWDPLTYWWRGGNWGNKVPSAARGDPQGGVCLKGAKCSKVIERDGCNLQRWNPPERSASAACGGDLITYGCQQQTNTIIQKLSLGALIDMDQLTYFAALHLFESCKSSPNILPTHSYQLPLHWVTNTICVGEMRIFCSWDTITFTRLLVPPRRKIPAETVDARLKRCFWPKNLKKNTFETSSSKEEGKWWVIHWLGWTLDRRQRGEGMTPAVHCFALKLLQCPSLPV